MLKIILLVLSASVCAAQPWAGIIDPTRAIDWSTAGVIGGIPARTTQCGSTISAYSGTAGTINTAISSCTAGQHVQLGTGTFNLSTGINFGSNVNVTVRGNGASSTKLAFSNDVSCNGLFTLVCMAGSNSSPGGEQQVANWTAGYSQGVTSITVANSTSIVANSTLVNIDQLDEVSDTGTIWNCLTDNVCSNSGSGGFARGGNRSQQQQVLVTACSPSCNSGSSTVLTISPGLYMPNWASGQTPQAWWATTTTTGNGIEDVSIDSSAANAPSVAVMMNCYQCWVKGVRSLYANRNHVWIYESSHSTVRDSYFFQNQSHASVSYGVEISPSSSDNLVENNIFDKTTDSNPNQNGGAAGNVVGYNYTAATEYTASAGWFQASDYEHASGNTYWLREGNVGLGFAADNVHGTHHFTTLFRNRYSGWQSSCSGSPCTAQTIAIHLYAGTRYYNVIGNVLGTSTYHTNYQCSSASTNPTCAGGDVSIYTLGYTGNGGGQDTSTSSFCLQPACSSHGDYDPQVSDYLMRWGNYDTVTAAVRFVNGEVPSGSASFPNAVPGSTTLPASFYLAAKPASWWGTPYGVPPWPATGPDVSGGNVSNVGGHANKIPAQLCYENTPDDPGYTVGTVRTFNAAACYTGSSASVIPSAPMGAPIFIRH